MGNCLSLSGSPGPGSGPLPASNNQLGSSQFHASLSNTRLPNNGNSTSLGFSSHSGRISRFFGPSSSNNTSTSLWGSENSQVSLVRHEQEFPNGQILDVANLTVFTYAELKAATKNFRSNTLLGEGGFGRVYKGCIKERAGTKRGEELTIAIKMLNSDSRQGFEEWQSEVNFLGRLSHPNLVKLFGLGQEDGRLFLVYEFLIRGSLDNHLFGRGASVRPLSWDTRLKIMIGAARGLAFLHTLEKKIIYRDFKPSNILLDKTYTPKLSDFGLAKSGPSPGQSHVTTQVMGTSGYAAPEYIATEMLTGSRIGDIIHLCQQQSVQMWLKSNILNRGKMRSNMDARLDGKYPPKLALEVAQLTLKCIQTDVKVRPSMIEVVETLETIEAANVKPADNIIKRATNSRAAQLHGRPDGPGNIFGLWVQPNMGEPVTHDFIWTPKLGERD